MAGRTDACKNIQNEEMDLDFTKVEKILDCNNIFKSAQMFTSLNIFDLYQKKYLHHKNLPKIF